MKIAQVAPLWERVPPPSYGGIELVVSHLTDELVRRGHEVTLFASGDSQTLADLKAVSPLALRLDKNVGDYAGYEIIELSQVYQQAAEFDIIHSHVGMRALPLASLVSTPTVHTLHNNFTPDNQKVFRYHHQQPYVSISEAQRQIKLNYVATVYNGIETSDYPFIAEPQEPQYLAFLGRFSPEKGPHQAIAIAKQTGWRLKMAGKVDVDDAQFFEQEIVPHIDGQQIEYLGEINHAEKAELLGNATITLFPINWQEPFGLVMIESMATGTPVIAMNLGSVQEVIVHGETGFICQNYAEMATMIPAALALNRQACRKHIENKFSVNHMVNNYEAVYQQIIKSRIHLNSYLDAARVRL
ncbi:MULTISPECIES: glycosyltransferase family 4 protein [Cyanophyceae]|uniref:glycosyltransferase family 4 protein n=1 Tax=Cyanophyceae TaxID=3028117 RepID=UPI00232FC175|nr:MULTISPECIES: glycosyltransferase family 4 protein [Cyanophyceae]MDB9355854.1 glycosyltransferase family 4 protein [Nodularia spumigena CS-587/03]MDB9338080.1 glycosyltransferase family 4 protein [Nodularia spumigena CS-589/07]MDB9359200.1 glycosyltransferase family 4 protein [Nodularia spumigena CS-588/02]MDB9364501.1 glycosyltransferase family 4 protein [Nodularia spumigena CS-588/02A10]MDB9398886.1 glycosyltransferase family 4 protein [Microcystis aeruginosa CS-567/02-A1]